MEKMEKTDTQYDEKLGPPPAYSEQTPAYSEEAPSSSSSRDNRVTTNKIPSPINFYTSLTKFWLGRHADEKLFAASFGLGMMGRTVITLYDGPSKDCPVMVTSIHKNSKYIITIPNGPTPISVKHGKVKGDGEDIIFHHSSCGKHAFSIEVGGEAADTKPHMEEFEWRQSVGTEVRTLAGLSYGWKLVRLQGPSASNQNGTDETSSPVTSEGLEIVAIVAQNGKLSLNKSALVKFTGSGLTGELGERWQLAAVLSGLLLWYRAYMYTTAVVS